VSRLLAKEEKLKLIEKNHSIEQNKLKCLAKTQEEQINKLSLILQRNEAQFNKQKESMVAYYERMLNDINSRVKVSFSILKLFFNFTFHFTLLSMMNKQQKFI
jgi:hypothetical protein